MSESIHSLEQLSNIILRLQQNDPTLTEIFFAHYFKGTFNNILEILELLKTNSTVIKLSLSSLYINDIEMEHVSNMLQSNKTITKLWIIGCSLTENSITILADTLRINTTLVTLNISNNNIGNNGMMKIYRAINENQDSHLTNLYVDQNNIIYDENITNFMLSLRNPTFPYLDNSHISSLSNIITSSGFNIICKHLETNQFINLNKLKFVGNLSDIFLSELCTVLKKNKTIKFLDLSHNKFNSLSFLNLGEMLRVNTTLLKLNLNYSYINTIGAIYLSVGLTFNSSLKCLCLDQQMFKDDGMIALKNALINNHSLIKLSINMVNINWEQYIFGSRGEDAIIELLTQNTTIVHKLFNTNKIVSYDVDDIIDELIEKNRKKLICSLENDIYEYDFETFF